MSSRADKNAGKLTALDFTGASIGDVLTWDGSKFIPQNVEYTGSAIVGFSPQGTGTVATTLQEKAREVFSVFATMTAAQIADVNARTELLDVTAPLVAATSIGKALNKTVFFPNGVYISSGLPAIAGAKWIGESTLLTTIKLKNGTNAGLITSPTATIDDFTMENFRLDGNAANNTAGTVLEIKGWQPTLRNIVIVDSPGKGMVTDAGTVSAERQLGPCGHINNILIDRTQEDGWVHNGGSDADVSDIVVIDAGLKTHNTYIGIAFNTSARVRNVHYWNRATTNSVPAAGVYVGGFGGCNFTDCHFEGGVFPLLVASNANTFESCAYYAPRGNYALSITGAANKVSGVMGIGAHHLFLNYKGLYLAGVGNTIDLVDVGCLDGSIHFAGSETNNKVNIGGYRASGPIIVGTPSSTDDISVNIVGPAGSYFNQVANSAWSPYTTTVTSGTGTITSYTAIMFYKEVGKKVDGRLYIELIDAGTAGFSIDFTLPVIAKSGIGMVTGREGTAGALLLGWLTSTSKASIQKADGTFVGGTGNKLLINFTYEAA